MISSGVTATATSGDTAVTLFDCAGTAVFRVTVVNEGGVAGFFSIDGGTTWARLPATSSVTVPIPEKPRSIICKVKRIAGGSNLSGVYGFGE